MIETGLFWDNLNQSMHKGFIWGVFVYNEYRGKGIGKQLMDVCIEKASNLSGLQKILLGASHVSNAALSLYKKMGFKEYGRETNAMIWDGEYIDEVLLEKILLLGPLHLQFIQMKEKRLKYAS